MVENLSSVYSFINSFMPGILQSDIGKQCIKKSVFDAKSADPDQTPQNAASDLGLHFLHQIQNFYINYGNNKN